MTARTNKAEESKLLCRRPPARQGRFVNTVVTQRCSRSADGGAGLYAGAAAIGGGVRARVVWATVKACSGQSSQDLIDELLAIGLIRVRKIASDVDPELVVDAIFAPIYYKLLLRLPRGGWKSTTDQVLSVWQALLAKGSAPASIGLFGDSAGGGLAAGSVLKMRDQGLPLPGALYLMSPWSDVSDTGDSYQTLSPADPVLDLDSSSWNAAAYADPKDQKNPYVSPVYGDYSKAFPPTLIQDGTREMFLSNCVREYQAIRGGGHEAVLDLYKGMPHVFQASIPNTPESPHRPRQGGQVLRASLEAQRDRVAC